MCNFFRYLQWVFLQHQECKIPWNSWNFVSLFQNIVYIVLLQNSKIKVDFISAGKEVCFFSDRTVRQSGAVNFIFATSAQQKKTFGQSFGESFLPMETLGLDTGRFPSFIYGLKLT
jgi:hypothetical protein